MNSLHIYGYTVLVILCSQCDSAFNGVLVMAHIFFLRDLVENTMSLSSDTSAI